MRDVPAPGQPGSISFRRRKSLAVLAAGVMLAVIGGFLWTCSDLLDPDWKGIRSWGLVNDFPPVLRLLAGLAGCLFVSVGSVRLIGDALNGIPFLVLDQAGVTLRPFVGFQRTTPWSKVSWSPEREQFLTLWLGDKSYTIAYFMIDAEKDQIRDAFLRFETPTG